MFARIRLSTGEYLCFSSVEDYAKFIVFLGHKYEYEVQGEIPRISYSPEMKKYAMMSAQLRANRIKKERKV